MNKQTPVIFLFFFFNLPVISNLTKATLPKPSNAVSLNSFHSTMLLLRTLDYPCSCWIKLKLFGPAAFPVCGVFLKQFPMPTCQKTSLKKKQLL